MPRANLGLKQLLITATDLPTQQPAVVAHTGSPLAQSKAALTKLLQQTGSDAGELPRLGTPPDPLAAARKWLSEQVQSLLHQIFGGHTDVTSALKRLPLETLAKGLIVAFLALLVVVLAVVLYRFTRRLSHPAEDTNQASAPATTATGSIDDAIAAAVRAGNWSLAARWRWRLFIKRQGLNHGVTPMEIGAVAGMHGAQVPLSSPYQLMFGSTPGSAAAFTDFAGDLAKLEASRQLKDPA